MEEACEIARLPEELVSAALARTSPRDACRAAAVSPAFRAAADSDDVWARFLPPGGLPPLADGELAPAPPSSKKELFLRLSAGPALLHDRLVSMWLDRETGTKCYMLSARNLFIVWGDTPQYWTWIPLQDSRFSEGAQLMHVCDRFSDRFKNSVLHKQDNFSDLYGCPLLSDYTRSFEEREDQSCLHHAWKY